MANENKKTILLVDDDEMQLTTAELFLKSEYEIYKMTSGEEAIEHLSTKKITPDLIMLDILMPKMDGWEVLKRIRAIGFLKDIPIIFLTSLEEEADKKQALKLGVTDFITKPYNMMDLKGRVKDAIKLRP